MKTMNKIRSKLEGLSRAELNSLAKELKVKYSKFKKEELITYILENVSPEKLIKKLFPTWWQKYRNLVFGWASILGLLITAFTFLPFNKTATINNTIYPDEGVETFDPNDTTNLKILLLPFHPDANCVELEVDYKRQILERLEEKKQTEDLAIKILELDSIDCPVIDQQAREIGEERLADMVIWGSYKENVRGVEKLRVRYTLVKDFSVDTEKTSGDTGMQPLKDLYELREGYLQTDVDYVIYWIEGMTAYEKGNYKIALHHFEGILNDSIKYKDLETHWRICRIWIDLGKNDKALEYGKKAIEISRNSFDENPHDLSTSYNNLAVIYIYLGKFQKALDLCLKALAIDEKSLSDDPSKLAETYHNLTVAFLGFNEHQKALEFCLEALKILEKILPPEHPDLAISYNILALVYSNLEKYQEALEFHHKAIFIQEKVLPRDSSNLAISYDNLAFTYGELGKYQEALEFNLKALKIHEKVLPADHRDLATSYSNLAFTYGDLGKYQEALEFNLKALKIWKKILPPEHPNLAILYSNTGRAYRDVGEYEKAIEYGKNAIRIGEVLQPKHQYLNRFYSNLGITYVKTHQYIEAKVALENSEKLKVEERVYRGWAMYYALQGDYARAIENLQEAIKHGLKDLEWVTTDDSLESIRGKQRYKNIVEQLQNNK